jgi:hypothetical protein
VIHTQQVAREEEPSRRICEVLYSFILKREPALWPFVRFSAA